MRDPIEATLAAFGHVVYRRAWHILALAVVVVGYGGAGQGGYADVISPPTRKPLAAGDVLMMDTGCCWDGYFCDFDRNWAIGRADDTARRTTKC